MQMNFLYKELTKDLLLHEALLFTSQDLDVGVAQGPIIGNVIEQAFRNHLLKYDIPEKSKRGADFKLLDIDLKVLKDRHNGASGKIQGYANSGPPEYSVLIFGYNCSGGIVSFTGVFFIPCDEIHWTRGNKYHCMLSIDRLNNCRVNDIK